MPLPSFTVITKYSVNKSVLIPVSLFLLIKIRGQLILALVVPKPIIYTKIHSLLVAYITWPISQTCYNNSLCFMSRASWSTFQRGPVNVIKYTFIYIGSSYNSLC